MSAPAAAGGAAAAPAAEVCISWPSSLPVVPRASEAAFVAALDARAGGRAAWARVEALELEAAGVNLGFTYPRPMLDHGFARKRALEAYSEVKKPATVRERAGEQV